MPERAVAVPEGIGLEIAAAVALQGMTAHYLTKDAYKLEEGERCLIHAGAGGIGLLLIQIAKLIGAEVFTTVGSDEKAELAKAAGADHVILYDRSTSARDRGDRGNPAARRRLRRSRQAVFKQSLGLLRRRGTMVTFGNASGPVDPIAPLELAAAARST